jgi:hypothetical protein
VDEGIILKCYGRYESWMCELDSLRSGWGQTWIPMIPIIKFRYPHNVSNFFSLISTKKLKSWFVCSLYISAISYLFRPNFEW